MQTRRGQRRAGEGAHLKIELRHVAGINAVVAGVVRPGRHFIGHQGAVAQHEELDAEHADIAQRGRNVQRRRDRRALRVECDIRRRHLGDGEHAVAVQVLLHRQVHRGAIGAACDDDANFEIKRQQFFEHAGRVTEGRPGSGKFIAIGDPRLALAVIPESRGFQDAGQQRIGNRVELLLGADQRVRRAGHAAAREVRLLGGPVLAHRDRFGAGRHAPLPRQRGEGCGRHVLEFGGHRGRAARQLRQPVGIAVVATDAAMRHQARRARNVRVKHRRGITHLLSGMDEHAGQLAAAHHPQRGAWRDEGGRGCSASNGNAYGATRSIGAAHVRSADMARAASVWRAR